MSEAGAGVGEMLISARSLAEYRGMFDLTDAELLSGAVLDCPGGAASFAVEARALGAVVVSVDPAYAWPAPDLVRRARDDATRASRYSLDHPEHFVWTWFPTTGDHLRERTEACERFVNGLVGPPRSLNCSACLPHLPFADATFALVVSSHLLFVYADRLDVGFHVEAIGELARVSAGEVRLFPLVDPGAVTYPELDELRTILAAGGIDSEIRRVAYETVRGGNELLACRRKDQEQPLVVPQLEQT
ncbi:MAG: hypothetical protein E6G27_16280 [Actinobacteria bacterium]|nr:MAG: hypothetical protein E6G27_16280 [Actinomycetota bacterium]